MNSARTHLPVILLFVILLRPFPAAAHKLNVFAWSSGNEIQGEVMLSGGRKAKQVKIILENAASHAVLLETGTDEQGKFRFPLPEQAVQDKPDLLVVANAGEGHRGEWLLKASEYAGTAAAASQSIDQGDTTAPAAQEEETAAESSSGTVQQAAAADVQTLRQIVAEELNKGLTPVRQALAESSEHKPSIQDILGGIGWIIGMAGLAAWMQSRRKQQS